MEFTHGSTVFSQSFAKEASEEKAIKPTNHLSLLDVLAASDAI